jgi:hypothetical protein
MKHFNEHTSSMIKSSEYNTETSELIVTFNNDTSYTYSMVTEQDYQTFVNSESIGQGFNQNIRKYQGAKLLTENNESEN